MSKALFMFELCITGRTSAVIPSISISLAPFRLVGLSSSPSYADDVIAFEHQTVAVDVDLALAVDQSRRWDT